MPRKDMTSREAIVKAEMEPDKWVELPTVSDVTLDGFRVSIRQQTIFSSVRDRSHLAIEKHGV